MTGTHIQPAAVKDILTGILFWMLIIIIMHVIPLMGIIAWLLLPLPILFYRLKAGRTGGGIIMAACLALLIVFTGNIAYNLIYFGFFLITGFLLGECIEKSLSIEKTMLYTLGAVFGIFALTFFIYSISQNQDIGHLITRYVESYKTFSSEVFSQTATLYPQMEVDIKSLEQFNSLFVSLLPALFINSYLTMIWLNILYIKKLLNKKGIAVKSLERLNQWKAPEHLVIAVIVFSVLMFLPIDLLKADGLKVITANCLLILMFIYLLQGIAVASFFFEKKRAPYVLRVFFYILITIQPLFMFLVVGCGLFDTWFNFRKIDLAT